MGNILKKIFISHEEDLEIAISFERFTFFFLLTFTETIILIISLLKIWLCLCVFKLKKLVRCIRFQVVIALLVAAVSAASYEHKYEDHKAISFQHQVYKAHSVPIKVPVVHYEYKKVEYKPQYESYGHGYGK